MSTPPLDIGANLNAGFETFSRCAVALILGLIIAGFISAISLGICGPPMTIGYLRLCVRAARGETVQAGEVFDGFQFFGPAWVLMFLIVFGVIVASCTIVGGIIVAYLFFWAPTMMADGNRDAIDCLKRSYEYNVKEIGPVVVFMIVIAVIMHVGHGVLLGGLVTIPIASAMRSHGYLRAFAGADDGAASEPAATTEPVPDPAAEAMAELDQLDR